MGQLFRPGQRRLSAWEGGAEKRVRGQRFLPARAANWRLITGQATFFCLICHFPSALALHISNQCLLHFRKLRPFVSCAFARTKHCQERFPPSSAWQTPRPSSDAKSFNLPVHVITASSISAFVTRRLCACSLSLPARELPRIGARSHAPSRCPQHSP